MTTWYISTTGNDTTGTGTYANPFLTFYRMLQAASDGDTCVMIGHASNVFDITSGGMHGAGLNMGIYWQNSNLQKGIDFEAHPDHPQPIISGMGNTYSAPFFSPNNRKAFRATGVRFTNFVMHGNVGSAFGFTPYNQSGTMELRRCTIDNIKSATTSHYANLVSSEGGTGYDGQILLDACVMYDCGLGNAQILGVGGFARFEVRNSIFVLELGGSNAFRGVFGAFGGVPEYYEIKNNIFFNASPTAYFSACQGAPNWAGSSNNCVYGFTSNITDGGANYDFGLATSTSDPLFWDWPNRDFRLRTKDGGGNPNPIIEAGVML